MGNTLQRPPTLHQDRKADQEMQPPPPSENQNPEEEEEELVAFTCEICIEPTSFPVTKSQIRDQCFHPFCTDCMIKYIVAKLEYGAAGARIRCPALTCDRTLDPRAWEPLVGPAVFDRWCEALCKDAIADLSRCHCPHAECNALIVNECGGGTTARKSKCPDCGRWFCFGCGRSWHAGFGCDENGETRDQNDVAFGRLAEERKWKRCPRCRHFVELVAGCKKVRCRCGMCFCYECGKPINLCSCRSAPNINPDERFTVWMFLLFLIIVVILAAFAATHHVEPMLDNQNN